jgi:hypothetical protein
MDNYPIKGEQEVKQGVISRASSCSGPGSKSAKKNIKEIKDHTKINLEKELRQKLTSFQRGSLFQNFLFFNFIFFPLIFLLECIHGTGGFTVVIPNRLILDISYITPTVSFLLAPSPQNFLKVFIRTCVTSWFFEIDHWDARVCLDRQPHEYFLVERTSMRLNKIEPERGQVTNQGLPIWLRPLELEP